MQYQNEQSSLIIGNGDDAMIASSHKKLAKDSGPDSSNIDSSNLHKRMFLLFSVSILLAGLAGHSFARVQYQRIPFINSDAVSHQNTTASSAVGTVEVAALTRKHHKHSKHHKVKKEQKEARKAFQSNLYQPSMEVEIFYHSSKKEREQLLMSSSSSIVERLGEGKPKNLPHVGCQATVILIRHCEKGSIREHCNAIGFERASYIANIFGNEAETKWPAPSYLFATTPGDRSNHRVRNYREIETLQPLSDKIDVPINSEYGTSNRKAFAKDIFHMLRSGAMCGKVALISWKHEDIPHLARELGCGPEDGCPANWANGEDFDSTWQILYSYHKQLYPSFVVQEKKNKHKVWGRHPEWWISGHVEMEGFDPLQFSKQNGVY